MSKEIVLSKSLHVRCRSKNRSPIAIISIISLVLLGPYLASWLILIHSYFLYNNSFFSFHFFLRKLSVHQHVSQDVYCCMYISWSTFYIISSIFITSKSIEHATKTIDRLGYSLRARIFFPPFEKHVF